MLFLLPTLHFINDAPSHTKSPLVKYATTPSPAPPPLKVSSLFESVNMVALNYILSELAVVEG